MKDFLRSAFVYLAHTQSFVVCFDENRVEMEDIDMLVIDDAVEAEAGGSAGYPPAPSWSGHTSSWHVLATLPS